MQRKVSGRVLDVNVFRGESSDISDHYLVEGKLRVVGRWRKQRRSGGREVLKVSALNVREKEREYQERLRVSWDARKERPVEAVEEEWKCFKEVLGCAK